MAPMKKENRNKKAALLRTSLRLSHDVICAIDLDIETRTGNISRNTWILEAIEEKLRAKQKNRQGAENE